MLSDRLCRLLTAYVDGELSVRERQLVRRLVQQSAEARTLLRRLQHDADGLRRLPRRQPEQDLSRRVLQAIAAQPARPARPAPVPTRGPVRTWAARTAAAAALVLVSTGSYLYFAARGPEAPADPGLVVSNPPAGLPSRPEEEPAREPVAAVPPQPELIRPPTAGAPGEAPPPRVDVAQGPERKPGAEEVQRPEGKSEDTPPILTAPIQKMEMFAEVADPRFELPLRPRDLDRETPRRRLWEELHKDRAYRLDVRCTDTAKAFERLQTAFQAEGVRLLIDQGAQNRLTLRLQTNYVLLTEHVTPGELTRILQQAGRDDRKAEAKRRGEGQFDRVLLNRMTANDHKKLAQLLGVDPAQLQAPRPLAAPSEHEMQQALRGQGGPHPEPGGVAAPVAERVVLVLAYNPVRPRPASSKEVQLFLDSRKEPRAGTIQMLLVLLGHGG
jgi:hypothetical protein